MTQPEILEFANLILAALTSIEEHETESAIASIETAIDILQPYDAHWMNTAKRSLAANTGTHGTLIGMPTFARYIGQAAATIANYTHDTYANDDLVELLDGINHAAQSLAESHHHNRHRHNAVMILGRLYADLGRIDRTFA
jgi:predicted nucleotide-binding protein